MSTGRIDSFYNIPEIAKEQQAAQAMLNRTLALIKQVQDGIAKTSGLPSPGASTKPSTGGASAKKEVDALAKANSALTHSISDLNVAMQAFKQQTTINNNEARQMAKAQGLVGGAYDKLSGSLELARKQYRNLAAEEKHLSDEGVNLSKNISAMDAKIKAIDASMGNHQRNVGNYAGSFNALGNSVNQLSRELPAFTVSAQTGFLAISNNLPILADAIKGVRTENAALAAEGKPTTSVLKQLAGAVFSWGSALSIGITLLTVYGKDIVNWIGSLFSASDAMDVLSKHQKEFDEISQQAVETAGKEIAHLRVLEKVATDVNIPMEKRKRAVDELQKQYPDYLKNISDEAILQGNAAGAINRAAAALYNKALAQAAEAKAAKLGADILSLEEKRVDLIKKQSDASKALNKEKAKGDAGLVLGGSSLGVTGGTQITNVEKLKFAYDDATESLIENVKQQAALTKEIDFYTQKSAELAVIDDPNGKTGKEGNKTKLENAKSYFADFQKVVSDEQRLQLQAEANVQERIQANEKDTLDARLTALKLYTQAKQALINSSIATELQQLSLQRADIVKDYDEKIAQAKANKESTAQLEAAKAQELISFNKYATEQSKFIYAKYYQELLDLERDTSDKSKAIFASQPGAPGILPVPEVTKEQANELLKIVADTLEKQDKLYQEFAKKREELLKSIHDKEIDLAGQALNTINDIAQGAYDRKKNAIQDEIDLITERSQAEIDAVKNSSRTEQEKADAITTIQASAQARKEALELRQRRIDEQKAKFERAFQLFEVGIQTIKAISAIRSQAAILSSNPATAALASLAYAQIPLVLASGALSIASILAKPIPKFEKGTKSSPEGFAIVGEKGAEGRINPDGSFGLTPGKPTLTYLRKGTEIIPNHELMSTLPQLAMSQQNRPMTEDAYTAMMVQKITNELSGKMDILNETIKNKKETHFSFGPDGLRAAVKQGATWTEYLNRGWKD